MKYADLITKPPFNIFPYKNAPSIIDKLEYLGEESSPYEISPGTDLCISDTYYSLGFLTYLHAFGRVVKKDDKWLLDPQGKSLPDKPYRFTLISDAVEILKVLQNGPLTIEEIAEAVENISEEKIEIYLNILNLLSQKGRVNQVSKGWDATFQLKEWD